MTESDKELNYEKFKEQVRKERMNDREHFYIPGFRSVVLNKEGHTINPTMGGLIMKFSDEISSLEEKVSSARYRLERFRRDCERPGKPLALDQTY
jgi:hypothetical protein